MVNNHEHGSCCSSSRWILVVSITCEQGYNSQQTSYWSRKPDTSISCVDYFVCRRQREVTSHSHRKRSCFPYGTNATENSGTTLSNHYQRSDSLLFSPALCLLCGCGQNRIQRNSPFFFAAYYVGVAKTGSNAIRLFCYQNRSYGSTTGTKGYVHCHCEPMWGQDWYQGLKRVSLVYTSPAPLLVLCVAVTISVAHVAMCCYVKSHDLCDPSPLHVTCDMTALHVNNGVGWRAVSLVFQVRLPVRV